MRHHTFKEANTSSIAVLSKSASFSKHELRVNYVDPLIKRGIAEEEMMLLDQVRREMCHYAVTIHDYDMMMM